MEDLSENSVTRGIVGLKTGDPEAARRLWERYFQKLTHLARKKLGNAPRGIADEEDVALSVFRALCSGAADGRFSHLSDRNDLWILLLALTKCKAVDQVRREKARKRGGDEHFTNLGAALDGDGLDLNDLAGEDPTPEFVVMMQEEHQRLLALLRTDEMRQIAMWRIEGHSNEDMARRLGVSVRTVERKLNLIRTRWSGELER